MLDHHIMLMVQAKANRDNWKYWVYFEFVLNRLLPYVEPSSRQILESDLQTFKALEREINDDLKMPEPTKEKRIEKLRLNFIDTHTLYIALNLPKTGIISVVEDTYVDFQKQDYETLKRAIRAGSAFPTSMKVAVAAEEKRDAAKELAKAMKEAGAAPQAEEAKKDGPAG